MQRRDPGARPLPAGIPPRGPGAGAARPRRGAAAGPGFGALLRAGWRDLRRDPTPNRMRRLGQALVLARELPAGIRHLHVHYLHTPASVVRYAALLRGPALELLGPRQGHLDDARLGEAREARRRPPGASTCTARRARRISRRWRRGPTRSRLLYHGLDLGRFPAPPDAPPGARRQRSGRSRPDRHGRPGGGEEGLRRPAAGAGARCRPTCTGASPMSAAASCWPA